MPLVRRLLLRAGVGAGLALLGACAGDSTAGTGTTRSDVSLHITPKVDSLGVGESRQLTARVTDAAGIPQQSTVAWMSLNNAIATVSSSGSVTGVSAGLVGVVATIGGAADTASIVVRAGELVVEPNAVITSVGEALRFSVTTRSGKTAAAAGLAIMWNSSDPTIATVDADGNVITVGAGDVTLTATVGKQTGSAVMSVRQKDIASLRVTPTTSSIFSGETQTLQFVAYDDAGRAMALAADAARWSSSNAAVLAVSDEGVATGKAKGAAIVTAKIGSKSATATVNVLATPVSTIAVAVAPTTLDAGQTATASATLKDATGNTLSDRTIAWQSSNPAIAVVNSSGGVSAVAKGSVTITAISEGKTGSAPLTVAAKAVAGVTVTPNPASATVGQTAQLSASAKDGQGVAMTGRTFTWTSSNSAVASVSASGLVTAVGAGTATISATTDGVTGQAQFTTTAVTATSVSLSPSSPHVQVGAGVQLVATAYDASGSTLSTRVPAWSSSNPTVATVSNDGRVTGVSVGNTTITATVDGKSAATQASVDAPPPAAVASINVSLSTTTIMPGQTSQATAILRDAAGNVLTGRTVTWSSAAPLLASVSASGLVTGVASGSATIVATSEGQTGYATLVVGTASPAAVSTVTLSATSTSLLVGQSQAITATLKDASGNVLSGRTIAWSSSSLGVLTVSPTGQVQAVGVGTATITATSEGKSGTLSVSVSAAPVAPVASVVVSGNTSLNVGQTATFSATPKDGHGLVLTGRTITWSSSAPNVASVSSSGVVTAVSAGTAVINATSEGVVGSLALTANPVGGTLATVSVSLASGVLSVGQTTQASASGRDAAGNPVSLGTPTWSTSNAAVATVSMSGVVSAVASGSATITASVSGKTGSASVSIATTPTGTLSLTPPALPTSEPSPNVPAPTGKTIRVAAGGDLQAALNNALPGDVVALASGATFVGNFILPAKACTGWVTVRTDVPDSDLPGAGQRITPSYASKLAKIMSNNPSPAIKAASPTCQWRLFGLEVAVHSSFTGLHYGLLALGDGGWVGGGDVQTSLAKVPNDLVLDRLYVHGQTTSNLIRCVVLNSGRSSLVNSYIDQCHARGFDSQAVEGWNGPGPFLIQNNFLAGAGENVMFGGADPGIYGLSPSDITIRGNHIAKDPAWKGVWTVKNLFELKNARRVLVENNIFENNWADAQAGMAIVIKSSQDACGTCTWEGTTDLTFRYNRVRNSPRGVALQGVDCSGQACVDVHVQRVRIENNLFENIGSFNGTGQDGWLFIMSQDLKDISIAHNTFLHNVSGFGLTMMGDVAYGAARNISFRDNVFTNPIGYGLMYSGTQVGVKSMEALASSSWEFNRNVMIGVSPEFVSLHPAASFYPTTVADVGFTAYGSGDYRLTASSPYKGKATDGTDPGADYAGLSQRTATVR